ncbi:MAG TPA: glycosyltransferase, partial [Terriglobia bacterium]|nr:glycosyltransferase [Terriglobia bacterium]
IASINLHRVHMIEGQDIICFCNDWDGDPLSKKHIMQRFAKRNRVLWVNSVGIRRPEASVSDLRRVIKKVREFVHGSRKVDEGIHVFSPLAFPFHGSAAGRWINRKVLRWSLLRVCGQLGLRNPITWVFIPASAEVAGALGERTLVYHCVDEYTEFTGADKAGLLALEQQLMKKSHCVIVSSDLLMNNKRRHNRNTFLVTHGVDVEHFRKACLPTTVVPDDIRALKKPIIGFFGLIADWVDLGLIRSLAMSRPEWTFVLIGKSATSLAPVEGLTNVHLLGQKPYVSLPAYARAFDVALLPFIVNELTLAANPLKLREYLAAGLPVVSSALPEAEKLQHSVRIGRNQAQFLELIQNIIDSRQTGPQLSISQHMDSESWDAKVEELSRIVMRIEAQRAAA